MAADRAAEGSREGRTGLEGLENCSTTADASCVRRYKYACFYSDGQRPCPSLSESLPCSVFRKFGGVRPSASQ